MAADPKSPAIPTPGRILNYKLAAGDHPHPGLVGHVRPAIVVAVDMKARTMTTFDYSIVVFTRGTLDFAVGRPGVDGTLSLNDVLLKSPEKAGPGDLFWPECSP